MVYSLAVRINPMVLLIAQDYAPPDAGADAITNESRSL